MEYVTDILKFNPIKTMIPRGIQEPIGRLIDQLLINMIMYLTSPLRSLSVSGCEMGCSREGREV